MIHQIVKPSFSYASLEPLIDAKTMEVHTEKHHQGYADKLNAALENNPDLQNKTLEELLAPGTNYQALITNMAGGVSNHNLFWTTLSPEIDQAVPDPLFKRLKNTFGKMDTFKEQFTASAMSVFGSGWTWLVDDHGVLKIINLPNQNSPITESVTPLLGLDVWEHAYYLNYQNRRADYIAAYWHIVNWNQVNAYLKNK